MQIPVVDTTHYPGIAAILEKVEGVSVMTDRAPRYKAHQGDPEKYEIVFYLGWPGEDGIHPGALTRHFFSIVALSNYCYKCRLGILAKAKEMGIYNEEFLD